MPDFSSANVSKLVFDGLHCGTDISYLVTFVETIYGDDERHLSVVDRVVYNVNNETSSSFSLCVSIRMLIRPRYTRVGMVLME